MNGSRLQAFFVALLWHANVIWFTGLAVSHDTTAAEFQTTRGRHITLTTDVSASQLDAMQLVESFDTAVAAWKAFFELPDQALNDWSINAYVMQDRAAFVAAGLLPQRVPSFTQGFAYRDTVWVMLQPSAYYTRHLLLHEGVHALVIHGFGGTGPSWFAEGTAELLGTHRSSGESVVVGVLPKNKESVPYWGRISLIEKRRNENAIPSIETVMRYQGNLEANAESYAWCWAVVMMLCEYPEYKAAYLSAARGGRDTSINFTRQFYQRLLPQWPVLSARWRLLCSDLNYGFEWDRNRVGLSMSDPLWNGAVLERNLDATRGWQSVGIRVPPQTEFQISASGRCTIAKQAEKSWLSEPGGVTIRYVDGKPLGQCVACFVPIRSSGGRSDEPLKIVSVESTQRIRCEKESWLVLKINDAVGERGDNEGGYSVTIRELR
ncbi:hypothetical protein Q31b_22040 [Novipirellula aureliae]|uniref:DUF1570 domain-containing protein n=1 Tax=Novipirellula aureliae TaxID=2527966 RepID=A0A5C6E6S9_9BACT|nr:hypothetical protein [Novipirellula aureliae]TWU43166.1 hypothetical protein Q31b_22040 [Novipirellula aureliae]